METGILGNWALERTSRKGWDVQAEPLPKDCLSPPLSSFACAICPHRPVLDTLAMLTAHRAGKKHLSSLQLFYGKKQPGKGTEQNPRQQNELERKGTKAEVVREGTCVPGRRCCTP